MKQIILNRLREPSTWAGLSIIATLFGAPPGSVDAVHMIVSGILAGVAVFAPEVKAAAAPASEE